MDTSGAEGVERELREFFTELTDPRERECLLCYVHRMLELAVAQDPLHWTRHWRDRRAPRAHGLERRLARRNAFCDTDLFGNGWRLRDVAEGEDGDELDPEPMPACPGVRAGSTQPCPLWEPRRRDGSDW